MHKNGNGTDYVSESIIAAATVKKGYLHYGNRKYGSVFLIETERMHPATLARLYEFVASGGRVFCIEKYPSKSLGWKDHDKHDAEVKARIEKLQAFPDRFVLLAKPSDNDFLSWYPAIQKKYNLTPFVTIDNPDPYVMVNRYIGDDHTEFFFLVNSNLNNAYVTTIHFPKEITSRRFPWVWDLIEGKRYRIELDKDGGFPLYLCPADSLLIAFDTIEKGERWNPLPANGQNTRVLEGWDVEMRHSCTGSTEKTHFHVLDDLKNTPYIDFTGTITYTKKFQHGGENNAILNLGKVWGIAEVKLNGEDCGIRWYGNRLYDLSGKLRQGENTLEVKVVTTMGNYIQTLKDENPIARKWTARPGRTPQPKQSMGLGGPVTLYESKH
jgi:hypothetical protein